MFWTKSHIFTLRDAPNDAEIPSHKLLVRGGYIKKLAPGIYTYQNLALRSLRKVEKIVRQELDRRGCAEVLMPMVQPKELWQETRRWDEMGASLLKFENRNSQEFCLGATHEEVVTDLVRSDVKSYRDLPRNLYQIQTKYRDEIRPRFGLMRGREFIMKDAYSFDRNEAEALKSYEEMYAAYTAIFTRLGLKFRTVEADAGNIGGSTTHEFHVLADSGEDAILACDKCDFAANSEVAPASENLDPIAIGSKKMEEFDTPGLRTIDDLSKSLGVPADQLVKTMFFAGPKGEPITVLLRGSDEVNPVKLKNILHMANPPLLLNDQEVKALTGAMPGSCGPVGLKSSIYMDSGVAQLKDFVVGANKDDKHLRNVNRDRDFTVTQLVDVREAKAGDPCPKCDGKYVLHRGIEVGHVFYLGNKYSKSMGATFLDESGASQPIEMGCYGIGVSRTMQSAVEQNFDKDGIIWPWALAPFDVHICLLDPDDPAALKLAEEMERSLQEADLDVLIDDRQERPGVKFKDADLLGMPKRVVIGKRGLEKGEVELVDRRSGEKTSVATKEIVPLLLEWKQQREK